ncbi:single-stranded DNA-binding protein, partial [Kistimonas scapharcae]|uniref:single-stranded DNA-binding protein n=1 Tax=Kistimonas scapharcae TaxID=1036133 RepID=UPI0031E80324
MRSFNHVALLGVAGKEAELRYFQNGDPIAICSLATNEYYKDKQTGEKKQKTQWHNLVFRGPIAEHAARMIDKGAKMFVTGMVKYQARRKQDGTYANYTNIVVDHWTLLDSTVT